MRGTVGCRRPFARESGVDASSWLMTDATRLRMDAQYLDATYDDFRYVTPLSAGPPVSGCVVSPQAGGFQVDCSGKRAPYAPEWTANLAAEHGYDLRNHARIVAGARVRYQSETLTGLDFTPLEYQDGYVALGASVTTPPATTTTTSPRSSTT